MDSELLPVPPTQQLSPYPVILSLENHCGLEQQAVMAHHLRSILGDMLVTQALDSQNPEELPSPEVMLPDPQPGNWICLTEIHPHPHSHYPSSPGPLISFCLDLFLLGLICHPAVLLAALCFLILDHTHPACSLPGPSMSSSAWPGLCPFS